MGCVGFVFGRGMFLFVGTTMLVGKTKKKGFLDVLGLVVLLMVITQKRSNPGLVARRCQQTQS